MFPEDSSRKIDLLSAIGNTFGGSNGHPPHEIQLALLALSHSIVEHRLYLAMRTATTSEGVDASKFGIRRLMSLTGLTSYGSIRRGFAGLIRKLSVEPHANGNPEEKKNYRVYSPSEIFARRREAGVEPYPKELQGFADDRVFSLVIEDLARRSDLGRREAMVALYCAGGLSNAEIGERLEISEKTVKFHLRNIFIKYGIKRRSELLGRLLAGGAYRDRTVRAVG
jgi:DNA-binding CsgD family transcriptional regulator